MGNSGIISVSPIDTGGFTGMFQPTRILTILKILMLTGGLPSSTTRVPTLASSRLLSATTQGPTLESANRGEKNGEKYAAVEYAAAMP